MSEADRKAFEAWCIKEYGHTMGELEEAAQFGWESALEWRDSQRPSAQINEQMREALDKLHTVVIEKNRAGVDWGDQFTDLMVALSLAQAALAAATPK